ncbi:MAG: hypothetical protein EBY61_05585, partial [Actinobacteria bacterium]|nr:hypothetical protein [Actinomycetota bacterium]
DQPYRKVQPGIQLLHCLANEAEGGESVLVDGLAATEAMRREQPDLYDALATIEVDFRYDMGTDVVIDRHPVVQLDSAGRFRQLRFNTKLDFPIPADGADLDAWYAGRRWLAAWMDDPAHQAAFRLGRGDLMFMDNHRVLHARTAFDPTSGHRHLQGCYGPVPQHLRRLHVAGGPGQGQSSSPPPHPGLPRFWWRATTRTLSRTGAGDDGLHRLRRDPRRHRADDAQRVEPRRRGSAVA